MLFNSLAFLLGYAPIVIGGFFLLGMRSMRSACAWLGFMSLAFYAWWHPPHTLILLASILFNFFSGICISRVGPLGSLRRKRVLGVALAINLSALCYYKYFGFFGTTISTALGMDWSIADIVLPLGISFFTFTQIAYLVDTYQGKVQEHDLTRYLLFVTYFPHLVAGPIIHHRDVMSQFEKRSTFNFNADNFTAGAVIFIIGLFKKVVIADSIAGFNTTVFALAEQGAAINVAAAWAGSLAYALQLYFDFSGYSDMAIGLSLMLNVRLPFNFDSPYKSRSIIDFWRRWHISLSTFLRDYLYIPLGGNRHGEARRYLNMFLTMLLGGLWHGAGWTFIVWGALHGSFLAINHAWRSASHGARFTQSRWYGTLCWALTLLAVLLAWIFFRAHSVSGALHLIEAMLGLGDDGPAHLPIAGGATLSLPLVFACLLPLLGICLWAPNSQEITASLMVQPRHFGTGTTQIADGPLVWRPVHWNRALALGLLLAAALVCISRPTEFLYFNF
jgi:D-alanyl-lipoteichoic acid acyltransferase DltB (MBOAT superfamily)